MAKFAGDITAITSAEDVAQALRNGIHSGRMVPGQRLVEADLVAELRTSRSRLREAFRRLESEGLVRIDHNRGASVRRIGRQEVIDTMEALGLVTEQIVERICTRAADPVVRASLDTALEEARLFRRDIARISQPRRFMDANAIFWERFGSVQGNPVLNDVRRRLETTIFRLVLDGLLVAEKERWVALHEDIATAALAGNRRQSRILVKRYMRDVQHAILALPDAAFD